MNNMYILYMYDNPMYIYNIHIIYIRGAYDKFPDFFRMGTFIDSKHMKL